MLAPEPCTTPSDSIPGFDPQTIMRRRRFRNTLVNIPSLVRESSLSVLSGAHTNQAIAIVEAVSDLAEGLTFLRSHRDRLVVIATPSTCPVLLDNGIEPEYVVATAVDDLDAAWTQGLHAPRTRLIAEAGAAPALFRAFAGRSHAFSAAAGPPWHWLRRIGVERTRLPARASIVETADDVARYLGASRVQCVGTNAAVVTKENDRRPNRASSRASIEPDIDRVDAHLLRVLRQRDLHESVPPSPVTSVVTPFSTVPMAERVERTATLAGQGETDLARWSDARNLDPQWSGRSWHAARLIAPGSHVLDVGAGAQALKQFLTPEFRYTPSDVVARTPETYVADLNRGEFPPGRYDVVTALGVLEYVNDLPTLFAAMRRAAPTAIVSYSASTNRG
jgi:hypothetical protein